MFVPYKNRLKKIQSKLRLRKEDLSGILSKVQIAHSAFERIINLATGTTIIVELHKKSEKKFIKIKCTICNRIEELSEEEIIEIGRLFDKKNLNVEEYLNLIQIYRSKDNCNIIEGQKQKHTWIYDTETKEEIEKIMDKYMSLNEEEKKLNNRYNDLKDKIGRLTEELSQCNKEIESLPELMRINHANKVELINELKILTGTKSIDKWSEWIISAKNDN